MHSSVVEVDGYAYAFTAKSGVGKSTHTALWLKNIPGARVLNGDKPLYRLEADGGLTVCGTPWNGKHRLDTNCRAEIKAICKIEQAKENTISRASTAEMLLTVLNQTIRPADAVQMDNLLTLIDKLLRQVNIYKLGCNISREAAELSFNTMSKGE
jgi:hypothetical protein